MADQPRVDLRVKARRMQVAELVLRGVMNHFEICDRLGMGHNQHSTISRDIKEIKKEWHQARIKHYGKHLAKELAKLDLIEKEAWAQWDRSKQDAQTLRTKTVQLPPEPAPRPVRGDGDLNGHAIVADPRPGPVEIQRMIEGRIGDPAFLQMVLSCIAKRATLMGFDKAPVVAVQVNNTNTQINQDNRTQVVAGNITFEAFQQMPLVEKQRLLRQTLDQVQ